MKGYLAKTPAVVSRLYPKRIWNINTTHKALYLTFDDGPIPELTPWVNKLLSSYNAKATFFCIGDNVQKHPELINELLESGHRIGNHTQNHQSAFKQSLPEFTAQVQQCHNSFLNTIQNTPEKTKLFRPPYGKLRSAQAKSLYKRGYQIIMWDVLSADFDIKISKETCLNNVINNAKPGSIIVFHDSLKAQEKLRYALPKVLEYFSEKDFVFKCIP